VQVPPGDSPQYRARQELVEFGCAQRLPNIVPPLLVQATLATAAAITAEASLSFLGLVSSRPTGARAICSIPPKISCRRRRGRRSGGDTEVRPMPDNSVRVGFGASSLIRCVVGHRLQSADSSRSRNEIWSAQVDPQPSFKLRRWRPRCVAWAAPKHPPKIARPHRRARIAASRRLRFMSRHRLPGAGPTAIVRGARRSARS